MCDYCDYSRWRTKKSDMQSVSLSLHLSVRNFGPDKDKRLVKSGPDCYEISYSFVLFSCVIRLKVPLDKHFAPWQLNFREISIEFKVPRETAVLFFYDSIRSQF